MNRLNEIHVFLRGGLGNQLFQYSTALYLAEEYGKKLILRSDLLPMGEDLIAGISRWPDQISSFSYSGEVRLRSFQPYGKTNLFGKAMQLMRLFGDLSPSITQKLGLLTGENTVPLQPKQRKKIHTINGYAAYKKLALSNRDRIRNEIQQIREPSSKFNKLLTETRRVKPIIFHIRQGDYNRLRHIYGNLGEAYYESAIDLLRKRRLNNPHWVFTDEKHKIPSSIIELINPELIVDLETLPKPIENLVLMSQASGLVASNSTFSWWACLLSDLETLKVAPRLHKVVVSNFDELCAPDKDWSFVDD